MFGESRDMDTPLVFAIRQRRRAIDHDLPLAQGKRAAVEQRGASKLLPGSCTGRDRAKEQERFPSLHDLVEGLLNLVRVWGFQRSNTGHRQLHCYRLCSNAILLVAKIKCHDRLSL